MGVLAARQGEKGNVPVRSCVNRDGGTGAGGRGAEGEGGGRSSSEIALARSRVTTLSLRPRDEEGAAGRGWLLVRARWVVEAFQLMASGEEG